MKRKIKICNVLSCFGLGGTERIIYYVAKYIDYSKFEFHIITLFSKDNEDEEPLLKEIRKTKAKIFRLQLKSWRDFKTFKKFISYIHRNKIDILHAHSGACEFWGPFMGKLAGIKINIYTQHHTEYEKPPIRQLQNWVTKHFLTNHIIAVSKIVKNDLFNLYGIHPNRSTIIYNTVDIDHFNSISKDEIAKTRIKLGISPDDFLIGNISRYTEGKGYPFFFEAAQKIKKSIPNAKFLVIANDAKKNKFEFLINKFSLNDSTIITKPVTDVAQILKALDLFLFTSNWGEGFGMVLVEALAAGLPIVSSNIGPTREIIKNGNNGLLPTPNKWKLETQYIDAEKLAESVIMLYKNSRFRRKISKNAYHSVKRFSIQNYIKSLEELYYKLIPTYNY